MELYLHDVLSPGRFFDTRVLEDRLFVHHLHRLARVFVDHARSMWPRVLVPELERRLQGPSPTRARPSETDAQDILLELCCTCAVMGKKTPIEVLAKAAPDLCPEERETFASWSRVCKPAFEVLEVRGERLKVRPVDPTNRTLTLLPGVDESALRIVRPGSVLLAVLVPVRTFYTPLGRMKMIPPENLKSSLRHLTKLMGKRGHRLATGEPATRTRWEPGEGQSQPGQQEPCPCNSGRRYKKCCMAR